MARSHLALPILFAVLLLLRLAGAEVTSREPDDLASALTRAASSHRLVLVNFTLSGSNDWNARLRDEILTKEHFLVYARENLELVEVDFSRQQPLPPAVLKQRQAWAVQYQINVYPTMLILQPDGTELARLNYMQGGPKTFVRELKRIAARATAPPSTN